MRVFLIAAMLLVFLNIKSTVYAGVVTTPCPDEEGGKYNHCRPTTRGCEPGFEENRDGAGNTNQDCTSRLYSTGAQTAVCCRLKDLSVYAPGIGTCPTIRSDGYLNYCRPGGSCGSYSPTSTADNEACKEYLYSSTSPLPPAVCCKSNFSVPLVATTAGSVVIKGKYYLDVNGDEVFNTGDGPIDNETIRLETGQSTTSGSDGDFEIDDAPVGGNIIYLNFSKSGTPKEFEHTITIPAGGMTKDFPLVLTQDGGTSPGGGGSDPGTDDDVEKVVNAVSQTSIQEYLSNLVGKSAPSDNQQARYSCASGNATEREYIKSHFQSLGLIVEEQSFSADGCTTRNIIGRYEGEMKDSFYLITAHMDSVANRSGTNDPSPGADDNGSGTAAVMEIAGVIGTEKPNLKHSVEFVLFSGEEQGFIGSKYYVNTMGSKNIKGLMNLDMVGISSGGNDCVDFTYGSGALGSAFASKAVDINTAYGIGLSARSVYADIPASDHYPFQARGKQAAFAYECVINSTINSSIYHSLNDKIENIDFSQLEKTAKVVAGAVVDLANE